MNRYLESALILTGALSYYWFKYLYAYLVFGVERYNSLTVHSRQWLIGLSAFFTCMFIALVLNSFNLRKTIHLLGLGRRILPAFVAAVCCCLPMYLGGIFCAHLNSDVSLSNIIQKAIWAGINEELVFRGFIVGLLVRLAGWHIVPAVILSAAIFAWGHLYQAGTPGQAILVFFVTSGAGIGLAVFYRMWGWNLWFPLFMHIFMNLSFVFYDMGDTVLLNRTANIARGVTILLAIGASVYVSYRTPGKQSRQ